MKIRELNLIGFGKFHNKTIELSNGINLIYGENEAGKTTIHNFIDGMFYGFLKPYAKRTIYLDEHSKYKPWNNAKYAGIIRFIYNDKVYRIERVFDKGKESTIIFLEDTGEDITRSIDTGSGGRILQPGVHFFGFNDAVYSNTVSIKQLESKTEDSLANEVRDKLINVSTTLDDNLSVERARSDLEKSLKDIGTIRATTSIYGRTHLELKELKEKKASILEKKDIYEILLKKDTELEKNLESKKMELIKLERKLDDVMILEKYNIYREGKLLKESIDNLIEKANKLKQYKNLSKEDYDKGRDIYTRIKYLNEIEIDLKNSIFQIDNKLKELEERWSIKHNKNKYIDKDYMEFEELEERKNKELYTGEYNEIEFLKRDYYNNIKLKKIFKIVLAICIILSLGTMILKIINITSVPLLINLITLPLIVFGLFRIKKIEGKLKDDKFHIETQEKQRLDNISNLEKKQITILERYGLRSKLELKRLYDDYHIRMLKDNTTKEIHEDHLKRKVNILEKLQSIKEEKSNKEKLLEELLKQNSSTDLVEFKNKLINQDIYTNILVEIKSKKDLIIKVLGKFTLETLEDEIKTYPKEIEHIGKNCQVDEIKGDIELKIDEISNIRLDKKGTEEKLNTLSVEISSLVEIDEEIKRKESIIHKLDNKRTSIEIAINTIEELSKDIHREFAPSINEKVGEIIQNITGGKYKDIKIDDNLEIGVINPITREILDINSLSGGTIDQLYFSLRLGIIDSIKRKGLPLILDDCFIQYDDLRLENMMKFLEKESKNRQIILFTCHKRESKILSNMNMDFNLISLT